MGHLGAMFGHVAPCWGHVGAMLEPSWVMISASSLHSVLPSALLLGSHKVSSDAPPTQSPGVGGYFYFSLRDTTAAQQAFDASGRLPAADTSATARSLCRCIDQFNAVFWGHAFVGLKKNRYGLLEPRRHELVLMWTRTAEHSKSGRSVVCHVFPYFSN